MTAVRLRDLAQFVTHAQVNWSLLFKAILPLCFGNHNKIHACTLWTKCKIKTSLPTNALFIKA
jgi:hypothetical protein